MSTTQRVAILAPFDGWCTGLEEVPDPVFSGRMLGDGMAVDPLSGIVLAPCRGEVVTLPGSAHAATIRTPEGADVLVHIGIDSVVLQGRGFESQVRLGQSVEAGQELIRFDLDSVARGAKTLLTPIVITGGNGLAVGHRRAPGPVKAGEVLFEFTCRPPAGQHRSATSLEARRQLTVRLRHGLHARPAALLSQALKRFDAEVSILAHGQTGNARSVTGIMALGVRHGETITITGRGADAARALEGFSAALEAAADHEETIAAADRAMPAEDLVHGVGDSSHPTGGNDGVLRGVAAVAGFSVGRATRIERRELSVEERGTGIPHEVAELARARANVRARLTRLAAAGGAARGEIAAAHVEFLDDPAINEAAQELIAAGKSAGFAWRAATRRQVTVLSGLDDPRLRERADDLLDVESHVLLALIGEARPMLMSIPERAVILADDLLPSELTALDARRLAAICLARGGATSHVAILASAMNIPMLVGLGTELHDIVEGSTVVVDADAGQLHAAPDAAFLRAAEAAVASNLAARLNDRASASADCRALDGTRVEVFANLGSTADAIAAVANGAEGCGLLRTEFLFIDRDTAPGEAEQLAAYQAIAEALDSRPLILRLMDVGGDKPLKYLPLPHEDNPALGLRGIRTALARPDLLGTQLRAALRVRPFGMVQLLLPMVTDVVEVTEVRAALDRISAELGLESPVRLGAMIETPAAALSASGLLRAVDFLSIGSNDLTQYTLAMDRGHAALAHRTDALHPSVLKLIALAAGAGEACGKTVAVCGAAAADRIAVPILLGLGIRELSVVPAAIPAIKRQIRGLRIEDCRALASRCLEATSATEVRALASSAFAGSGGAS